MTIYLHSVAHPGLGAKLIISKRHMPLIYSSFDNYLDSAFPVPLYCEAVSLPPAAPFNPA